MNEKLSLINNDLNRIAIVIECRRIYNQTEL